MIDDLAALEPVQIVEDQLLQELSLAVAAAADDVRVLKAGGERKLEGGAVVGAPEEEQYYRLATYERAMGDFLGPIWVSRDPSDSNVYPLVRGPS